MHRFHRIKNCLKFVIISINNIFDILLYAQVHLVIENHLCEYIYVQVSICICLLFIAFSLRCP